MLWSLLTTMTLQAFVSQFCRLPLTLAVISELSLRAYHSLFPWVVSAQK